LAILRVIWKSLLDEMSMANHFYHIYLYYRYYLLLIEPVTNLVMGIIIAMILMNLCRSTSLLEKFHFEKLGQNSTLNNFEKNA